MLPVQPFVALAPKVDYGGPSTATFRSGPSDANRGNATGFGHSGRARGSLGFAREMVGPRTFGH